MDIVSVTSPYYSTSDHLSITCLVQWDGDSSATLYTATSTDTDPDGADLWTRLLSGEFGTIASFSGGSEAGGDGTDLFEVMDDADAGAFPVKVADGEYEAVILGTIGRALAISATSAAARAAAETVYAGAAPDPADSGFTLDFDNDFPSGWHTIAGEWANGPAGTATLTGVLFVIRRGLDNVRQTQILHISGELWHRRGTLSGSTWTWYAWNHIACLSTAGTWGAVQDMSAGLKVGTGATLAKVLSATASLNHPSIAAASYADLTITVTGAAVNDSVSLGLPASPTAGIVYNAFVSSANTVTVRATNITDSAVDPAAVTIRVTVFSF